jgi:two-component system catabolic regulation response regulator CreB
VKPRVLVVEDEPSVVEAVRYALETEGFAAVCVSTCAEGLRRVEEGGVDLAVLDVGLPDGSGFDLCRAVRQRFDLPIVFLTARREDVDKVLGLELGGDAYLEKPFSPRVLTAHVRAMLRRAGEAGDAGGGGAEAASWGPFRVDEERKAVTCRGEALALTPKEYAILAAMVRRPGVVFSAERVLEIAGAENSQGEAARKHIQAIRRKIEAVLPGPSPVRNRPGFGYVLGDAE